LITISISLALFSIASLASNTFDVVVIALNGKPSTAATLKSDLSNKIILIR